MVYAISILNFLLIIPEKKDQIRLTGTINLIICRLDVVYVLLFSLAGEGVMSGGWCVAMNSVGCP